MENRFEKEQQFKARQEEQDKQFCMNYFGVDITSKDEWVEVSATKMFDERGIGAWAKVSKITDDYNKEFLVVYIKQENLGEGVEVGYATHVSRWGGNFSDSVRVVTITDAEKVAEVLRKVTLYDWHIHGKRRN